MMVWGRVKPHRAAAERRTDRLGARPAGRPPVPTLGRPTARSVAGAPVRLTARRAPAGVPAPRGAPPGGGTPRQPATPGRSAPGGAPPPPPPPAPPAPPPA